MTTQFVGLKEFRQNLSAYTKKAKNKHIRFIVLKKNIPVLEIKPLDEKDFILEKLSAEIAEARVQAKQGKVFSQEEVMKQLGID